MTITGMDRIGRYKVVRELGRGAMGVVYHAIDPNIGRPVAIKTIQLGEQRTAEEQERLRERLFREARSAGILSHPGIVTIYDVEQQDGLAYIAMEYVDGPTVDQWLAEQRSVPAEWMFSILAQTANALDYAHQKGIVHRDIKPANIMIAADGTAKIANFGIAKVSASEQFTVTGSIVGTPHYMSPEQVAIHRFLSARLWFSCVLPDPITRHSTYSANPSAQAYHTVPSETFEGSSLHAVRAPAPHRRGQTVGPVHQHVERRADSVHQFRPAGT